jgi:hypothetical protein
MARAMNGESQVFINLNRMHLLGLMIGLASPSGYRETGEFAWRAG